MPAEAGARLIQTELNLHPGHDSHRLAVEQRGLVPPLADRCQRRIRQYFFTREHPRIAHRAVFRNINLQPNAPLNAGFARDVRVLGLHRMNEPLLLHFGIHAHSTSHQ